MKLICFLAVLMAICSSAHAGGSISFSIGGHRVHIESSRYCRSPSCASVSVSRSLDWRRKRDRFDDDGRDAAAPARPAPQIVSPPSAPPGVTPPAQTIVATPPPAVYRPAATETQIVAAPPPPSPVQQVSIPLPPPPPEIAKPVESVRPAPRVSTASQEVEDEPADLPIGDWQTEGKGMVRIERPRKRPVGATPPGDKVEIQTGCLEHAEHDSADERECDIRGYNAQSAD
jgi:hypothetical protein